MSLTALEVKRLVKRFGGVHAIDRLSLALERKKITGIVGPNGSGKTTLLNMLSGVLPIDEGAVFVGDTKLFSLKSYEGVRYGITRTFQEVRLFTHMTVLDNLLVVLTERNIFSALFERHTAFHIEKAKILLEQFGLTQKKNSRAATLSYGQRKLLEIARALAMNAEIYLFDEPFAGLFPEMKRLVVEIVKDLRTAGKAVALIEHDIGVIRELADHIFVLDNGKLLAEGEPNEVLGRREVIEAYLGE